MTKVSVSNIAKTISERVSLIPILILHMKTVADTCASTRKVSLILLVAVPVLQY